MSQHRSKCFTKKINLYFYKKGIQFLPFFTFKENGSILLSSDKIRKLLSMISIAMATYNGEKNIKEQIESILNQTLKEFELIICDDASTDNTVPILTSFAEKDKRIKILKNEQNLGFKKNFEKILSHCTGEYIAFCDQDDIWFPNHLEVLYNIISKGNYDAVGANSILVNSNNSELGYTLLDIQDIGFIPKTQQEYKTLLLHKNIFQGTAMMISKSILNKALPFPENIKFHDWWIALIATENKGVYYDKTPILRYRQHESNVTENKPSTFGCKIKQFLTCKFNRRKLSVINILENFYNTSTSTNKKEIQDALLYAKRYERKSPLIIPHYIKHKKYLHKNQNSLIFSIRILKRLLGLY